MITASEARVQAARNANRVARERAKAEKERKEREAREAAALAAEKAARDAEWLKGMTSAIDNRIKQAVKHGDTQLDFPRNEHDPDRLVTDHYRSLGYDCEAISHWVGSVEYTWDGDTRNDTRSREYVYRIKW